MRDYFHQLADHLQTLLAPGEDYTAWLSGEDSDFVRFNRGRVRQAGHVHQLYLSLRLIRGERHCSVSLSLAGDPRGDWKLLARELPRLRELLDDATPDPHLLINTAPGASDRAGPGGRLDAAAMVEALLEAGDGHDLVGFLACGPTFEAYASSWNQRHWHQTQTFNLDWSLYAGGDKAVKSAYAGTEWSDQAFRARFDQAAAQLEGLRRPPRSLTPGEYRAYLAPAAMDELMGMLNWGGFSEQALRTRRSPLMKLAQGEASFHPMLELTEATAAGLAPAFQGDGFLRPDQVPLVREGRLVGSLISPRTAREYGIDTNGADSGEGSQSLHLGGGGLAADQVFQALGTGLYIGNLWYCNYSDRANARLTGMTRFASFWVENGEPVAPLNVMRFDDSLYRILGERLLDLGAERELLVDPGTYGGRQTASRLLPGALVDGLRLVL